MAETAPVAATEATAATENPVETPVEVEETNEIKVFVGNIDYKVTDEQLKEFFKDLKL